MLFGLPFFPLIMHVPHSAALHIRRLPAWRARCQAGASGIWWGGLGRPHHTPSQAPPSSARLQRLGACERARTALLLPKRLGTACAPRTAPRHLEAVHAQCCGPRYGHVMGGMPVTGQGFRTHALRTLPAPALRAGRTTRPIFSLPGAVHLAS